MPLVSMFYAHSPPLHEKDDCLRVQGGSGGGRAFSVVRIVFSRSDRHAQLPGVVAASSPPPSVSSLALLPMWPSVHFWPPPCSLPAGRSLWGDVVILLNFPQLTFAGKQVPVFPSGTSPPKFNESEERMKIVAGDGKKAKFWEVQGRRVLRRVGRKRPTLANPFSGHPHLANLGHSNFGQSNSPKGGALEGVGLRT